jgi:uncharacterized repeat protein (TIGR03803 family)
VKTKWIIFLGLCLSIAALAQVSSLRVNPLFSFSCDMNSHMCADGAMPNSLVQASDGNFYVSATASNDGSTQSAGGTILKLTPSGSATLLFTFKPNLQGDYPNGSLPTISVEGMDGALYGVTSAGGLQDSGVVFKIGKTGNFTLLHRFCSLANCADGSGPRELILASDGNLYGVTLGGGSSSVTCAVTGGCGTIFRLTTSGTLTTLHVLEANEGRMPLGMIQATDGNFYGATSQGFGGTRSFGTVFKFTSNGIYTIFHNITYPQKPITSIVQTSSGDFYGATAVLGSQDPKLIFRLTTKGDFADILQFTKDRGEPSLSNFIQATDGNLWGAASSGGMSGAGTVFTFTSAGVFLQAVSFGGPNGVSPSYIMQAADGKIYGTTNLGGSEPPGKFGVGTVFSLDAALHAPIPSIAGFSPASGKPMSQIILRGNHFVGTSVVTIHGVKASFSVLNTNFISVTVPRGATSGFIQTTNPGGIAESASEFVVQ